MTLGLRWDGAPSCVSPKPCAAERRVASGAAGTGLLVRALFPFYHGSQGDARFAAHLPAALRRRDLPCLHGPTREEPLDNRTCCPAGAAPRAPGTMQQSLFDFGAMGSFTDDSPAIACGEQPQQRMEHFGVTAMSDTELVAMVLQGNGVRAKDALAVARGLVAEAGSLAALAGWQPADFRRVKSIGRIKGCQLSAIAEIGRRMMRGPERQLPLLNRAELIAEHMVPIVLGLAVEKFYVLCLNRKNRLIKLVEATSGTATAALAHPREVFRIAIREGATAVHSRIIIRAAGTHLQAHRT